VVASRGVHRGLTARRVKPCLTPMNSELLVSLFNTLTPIALTLGASGLLLPALSP
jgi:hypothetical protein